MRSREHVVSRGLALRLAAVCLLAPALASCGGSASPLPAELSVLSVTFVTSNDAPLDPTLTALPKNTWIRVEFTKDVDPATVNAQTIRVRQGPGYATEAPGFLQVDGAVVRFDPTRRANGGPHPYGFEGPAAYRIQLRSIQEASGVVTSADGDPLALATTLDFSVGDQYIVEGVPPRVLGTRFLPAPDPVTGVVPSEAILYIDFDEVLRRESISLARHLVEPRATLDVRYTNAPVNVAAGVAGHRLPGTARLSPDARSIEFRPFFTFGYQPFEFAVHAFSGIQDLAGNDLANPGIVGTFTCDGSGTTFGTDLHEDFFTVADRDARATSTDWGIAVPGVCEPPPVTTRQAYVLGSDAADRPGASNGGTYYNFVDPLNGVTINQVIPNLQPPSNLGRRVQLSFSAPELGPAGTIVDIAWGPARNATFRATYTNVDIWAGLLENSTFSLDTRFSTNLASPTLLYTGSYAVAQSANVGNTPGLPFVAHKPGYGSGNAAPCNGAINHNQPLYDYTGFVSWPALQATYDWDPGFPARNYLVLEFEVSEGSDYQTIRSLYGTNAPCGAGLGVGPLRRLLGVVGDDLANPRPAPPGVIFNPEPTIMDTRITFSNFRSLAQSQFYAPPGDPLSATGGATFGTDSDYFPAVVDFERPGASRIEVEYQGATALDGDRTTIDVSQPFTPWTPNVDDCDGLPYIRWRVRFVGDYNLNLVPTALSVQLPVRNASVGP